jgi:hypothetical protein
MFAGLCHLTEPENREPGTDTMSGGRRWRVDQGGLSAATWFWLIVPMALVVVLSIVTFFTERKKPS